MSTIGLQKIIGPQLDLAFELVGELVRDCVFYKTESSVRTGLLSMGAMTAPVSALFVDYHSQDIDGSAVLLGDEKCFIRSREMAGITLPGPGDYLTEANSSLRRDVVAARQDPTGSFWVLQVRRVAGEDWGDFTPAKQTEDWGSLAAASLSDDWQT